MARPGVEANREIPGQSAGGGRKKRGKGARHAPNGAGEARLGGVQERAPHSTKGHCKLKSKAAMTRRTPQKANANLKAKRR